MKRIWTIGYEQATMAGLIAALKRAGVEVLADVRALPLSRRPGFSKTALAANLAEVGISYVHMKPLGTPADGRAAARAGNHEALERIYAGQLELPEAMASAAQLRDIAVERPTALLCYERDASTCHRSLLWQAMLDDFERIDLIPED